LVGRLSLEGEDILEHLAPPNRRPLSLVHENFGGQQVAVVVRTHDRAVSAGIENRDEIVDLERWHHPVASKDVTALANRPDDIPRALGTCRRDYRHDPVEGSVERRTNELPHPRVEPGGLPSARNALRVDDARDE